MLPGAENDRETQGSADRCRGRGKSAAEAARWPGYDQQTRSTGGRRDRFVGRRKRGPESRRRRRPAGRTGAARRRWTAGRLAGRGSARRRCAADRLAGRGSARRRCAADRLADGGPPGAGARRAGWPDGGPPGAGARRTGWPPCPVCPAWGRFAGAGVVAEAGDGEDGRGLGGADAGLAPERGCSLATRPGPILGGAGGRAACAAPAGPAAGDGACAGGEASTCPGLAAASTRGGPACAAPDCGTVGAVPDEPGRTVPGGLRLTTTVRRGFFTTTIRRRSSPPSAAGRCAAAPSGDAGAAPAGRSSAGGAAGATIFCSGLRFIRVARGRGVSSVSGRSVEGVGDTVVFSSLILNKYNSRAVRVESIRQANHSCQSCRLATRARQRRWS